MPEMKIGDQVWWRGMRMEITAVHDTRAYTFQGVHEKNPYRGTAAQAEALWDDELGFWYLPYTHGEFPTAEIGADGETKYVDPPLPRCICVNEAHGHDSPHGEVTFRVDFCTDCRLKDAPAAEVST